MPLIVCWRGKKGKKGKKEKKKKNVLILLTPNNSLRCFDSIVTTYINLSNPRSRLLKPTLGLIVLQIIIFLWRKEERAAPNNHSSYIFQTRPIAMDLAYRTYRKDPIHSIPTEQLLGIVLSLRPVATAVT